MSRAKSNAEYACGHLAVQLVSAFEDRSVAHILYLYECDEKDPVQAIVARHLRAKIDESGRGNRIYAILADRRTSWAENDAKMAASYSPSIQQEQRPTGFANPQRSAEACCVEGDSLVRHGGSAWHLSLGAVMSWSTPTFPTVRRRFGKCAGPTRTSQQPTRYVEGFPRRVRVVAAAALRDICDVPAKCIRGLTEKKLSVAKQDGGFLGDTAVFIDENPVEGRNVLRFLLNVYRSERDEPSVDIRRIMNAEQEADSAEDVAQMLAVQDDTSDAWRDYARRGKRARAKLDRAIHGAEQRAAQLEAQKGRV